MEPTRLLTSDRLPSAAHRAALAHRDLWSALAHAPRLADDVFEELWARASTDTGLARALVAHVDSARRRRHVLVERDEERPDVLTVLLRHVVPPSRWRLDHAGELVGEVADAVLANPRWPVEEQTLLLATASADAVVRWAADGDPSTVAAVEVGEVLARRAVGPVPVRREVGPWSRPLDVATVRRAVLRLPELAGLAVDVGEPSARGGAALVAEDPAVLGALVERAETTGDPIAGPPLLEALWANPSLPASLRARVREAAGRAPFRCHYLLPVPDSHGGTAADWSGPQVDALLAWGESARTVEHLSTWVVARLLARGDLSPVQTTRAAWLLRRGATAAGIDHATVVWLHRRHGLEAPPRRVLRVCYPDAPPEPTWPDEAAAVLAARLGDDRGAWEVAIALLRDGWEDGPELLATTCLAVVAPVRRAVEDADVA